MKVPIIPIILNHDEQYLLYFKTILPLKYLQKIVVITISLQEKHCLLQCTFRKSPSVKNPPLRNILIMYTVYTFLKFKFLTQTQHSNDKPTKRYGTVPLPTKYFSHQFNFLPMIVPSLVKPLSQHNDIYTQIYQSNHIDPFSSR